MDKKGFTLIEILIVIAIIATTLAVVYPSFFKIEAKFTQLLQKAEEKELIKKRNFLSFIKDEECNLKGNTIKCGEEIVKP